MFIPGTHGNGALLAQVVLTRAVSFADDFAGAWAYAGVSATAETVLDVQMNGSPIGTITALTRIPVPATVLKVTSPAVPFQTT